MTTTVAVTRTSGTPAMAAVPSSRTHRRWQILREQIQFGHDPCFQTDRRHVCREHACVWRAECLGLRAEWLR